MDSPNVYDLDQEKCMEYVLSMLLELGYEPTEDDVYNVYDICLGLLYYITVLRNLDGVDKEEDW